MAPLSEHEKRQFHLIEQRLKIDDPKFVKSMRLTSMWYRPNSRKILFGLIGIALGIILFCLGNVLIQPNRATAIPIGEAGIVIGVLGFYNIVIAIRDKPSQPKVKSQKAFMANLESKWKASYQSRWDELKKNGF